MSKETGGSSAAVARADVAALELVRPRLRLLPRARSFRSLAQAPQGNREDRPLIPRTRFQLLHWLRTSMWFWPLVCIVTGIAVSVTSVSVDRAFDGASFPRWLTGGPDAALEILGTVAGSMVSLTALVLTVVLVVIQLGMGQFSPRIVAEILQDKPSQFAIGIFVGTFAHAMLALSQVSTAEDDEFVPGVAILVAFVLVIVSIMVLVLYANHIGRKLRAASLIEAVGIEIRTKLDELYPDELAAPSRDPGILAAPRPGVLLHIDADRLVDLARKADVVLRFFLRSAILCRPARRWCASKVCRGSTSPRRSSAGSRSTPSGRSPRISPMARGCSSISACARSTSRSIPTTAVQAIDRIHDFLRRLSTRKFPTGEYRDETGTVRLIIRTLTWDDYVRCRSRRSASAPAPRFRRPAGCGTASRTCWTTPRKSDARRSSVSSASWTWRSTKSGAGGRFARQGKAIRRDLDVRGIAQPPRPGAEVRFWRELQVRRVAATRRAPLL